MLYKYELNYTFCVLHSFFLTFALEISQESLVWIFASPCLFFFQFCIKIFLRISLKRKWNWNGASIKLITASLHCCCCAYNLPAIICQCFPEVLNNIIASWYLALKLISRKDFCQKSLMADLHRYENTTGAMLHQTGPVHSQYCVFNYGWGDETTERSKAGSCLWLQLTLAAPTSSQVTGINSKSWSLIQSLCWLSPLFRIHTSVWKED